MTQSEFKRRWESDDCGGGITFDDIAEVAKQWGVASSPRTMPIDLVTYKVLKTANTEDAEDYKPAEV